MIRVRDIVAKINEICFTNAEREVLEFICGTRKITVAAQFKHYYKTACGRGTEEELYDAICITKAENNDIFEKLKSLTSELARYLNPATHDKQFIHTESNTFVTSGVNLTADDGKSTSNAQANSASTDVASTVSLDQGDAASGEGDEIEKLKEVWGKQVYTPGSRQQDSGYITPSSILTEEPKDEIKFRNFDTSRSSTQSSSYSDSKDTSTTQDATTTETASGTLNISSSRGSRGSVGTSKATGDQLYSIGTGEIPKLRNRYGLIFKGLFEYERYY